MLTKKDREAIAEIVEVRCRAIVQEELKACFGRTVLMEKGPRKQGDPEKRTVQEEVDIVSALIMYLPRIEAALRGMQEDVDHTKNRVVKHTEKIEMLGNAFLGMQDVAMKLAAATDEVLQIMDEAKKPQLKLVANESDTGGR